MQPAFGGRGGGHKLPAVEATGRQMSQNGRLPVVGLRVLGAGGAGLFNPVS